MPFCGGCGTERRDGARFCGRCGRTLVPVNPPANASAPQLRVPAASIVPQLRAKIPRFVVEALRPGEEALAAHEGLARANRRRAESQFRKVIFTTQRLLIVRESLFRRGMDEIPYRSVSGVGHRRGFFGGVRVVIHVPRASLTIKVKGMEEAAFIDQLISGARSGRPFALLAQSRTSVGPVALPLTGGVAFPTSAPVGGAVGTDLAAIDPLDFEELVRTLFERMGYRANCTKASHDGGKDIEVFDPTPIRGGRFIVQCKRYNGVVGAQYVRDLFGVVQHEGATKGILVATSHFSPDALAFAQGKPLELIDRPQLEYLLRAHGVMP